MQKAGFRLEKTGEAEFVLKGSSSVPIYFFATEELIQAMDDEVFFQAVNTANLPGLEERVCIMPDAHSGYGAPIGTVFAVDAQTGYISPGAIGFDINCGMRAIITNLTEQEIRPYLEALVNKLYEYVPVGVGKKGFLKINQLQLKNLVERGVSYLVKTLGIGWEKDIEKIEEKGCISGADFSAVSKRAVERGLAQIATLGSGNHYLEIQVVEKIHSPEKAKKLGIFQKGQIMIMVHCGSRGFGHQICSDYLREFERKLDVYRIKIADRQLVCLPLTDLLAKNYLAAMSAAANFAFVNREAITHRIRQAFEKVLGKNAERLGLKLIYDVAHNIGKVEEHFTKAGRKKFLVHRKGATRSFPGQVVIIGGSMETGSYLLLGREESLYKSFGSTAHGSGRTMSRAKAKRSVRGSDLLKKLKRRGIYIKAASFSGVAEEAGFAYKDINKVVEAVQKADLSEPLVYLRPIGNIKG